MCCFMLLSYCILFSDHAHVVLICVLYYFSFTIISLYYIKYLIISIPQTFFYCELLFTNVANFIDNVDLFS
jgi:hypothetical protein